MSVEAFSDEAAARHLLHVAYELLDAHDDTVRLAAERADALRWDAHFDYLRTLQRVGREALARATAGVAVQAPPD